MADFEDIRRGLAANLAVLTHYGISAYLLDAPQAPCIQVAGLEHIDYDVVFQGPDGYDAQGDRLTVQIEAALQKSSADLTAQEQLDALHTADGLKHALEADDRLTSRLNDDGTISISQEPACDALRVSEYLGSSNFVTRAGEEVLLATWRVDIYT